MSDDKTLLDNIGVEMHEIYNNMWRCPHLSYVSYKIARTIKMDYKIYDMCQECVFASEIKILHKKLAEMSRLLTMTMNKVDKLDLQDTMSSIEEKNEK